MLPVFASEKPRIINTKKLKKASLEALLANPHLLTPPQLGVGEFLAELDADEVLLAFRRCVTCQRRHLSENSRFVIRGSDLYH